MSLLLALAVLIVGVPAGAGATAMGSIGGRVTVLGSYPETPIRDVRVQLYQLVPGGDPNDLTSGYTAYGPPHPTDSEGGYLYTNLPLNSTYAVQFVKTGWVGAESLDVDLDATAGTDRIVDAQLESAHITGNVSMPDGPSSIGLADVVVYVYRLTGTDPTRPEDWEWFGDSLVGIVMTDENGDYDFPALVQGTYRVQFVKGGWSTQWYDGHEVHDNGSTHVVDTGVVDVVLSTNETRTGVDALMTPTPNIDETPPVTFPSFDPVTPDTGWWQGDVSVSLYAIDEEGGSGVHSLSYRIGDTGEYTQVSSNPITLPAIGEEGETRVSFCSSDASGNVEPMRTHYVRIDKTGPPTPGAPTLASASITSLTFEWPASEDAVSGTRSYEVMREGVVIGEVPSTVTSFSLDGLAPATSYEFSVRAVDFAGNYSTQSESLLAATLADTTPPQANATVSPSRWTRGSVLVSINATDDYSPALVRYTLGGVERAYEQPFSATAEGKYAVPYVASDEAGNETAGSVWVMIDRTAPTRPAAPVASGVATRSVMLSWSSAEDTASGVSRYEIYDGSARVATTASLSCTLASLAPGSSHAYSVVAVDRTGNASARGAVRSVTLKRLGTKVVLPPRIVASAQGTPVQVVARLYGESGELVTGHALRCETSRDGVTWGPAQVMGPVLGQPGCYSLWVTDYASSRPTFVRARALGNAAYEPSAYALARIYPGPSR